MQLSNPSTSNAAIASLNITFDANNRTLASSEVGAITNIYAKYGKPSKLLFVTPGLLLDLLAVCTVFCAPLPLSYAERLDNIYSASTIGNQSS